MPLKPEALDYEGVFPSRTGHGLERDAQVEVWPTSGKLKAFDDPVVNDPSPMKETSSGLGVLTRSENWIRRKGHTISFCALFMFTVVLYFRPYEFFPALSSFTSMAFYTGLVTLGIYAITQIVIEGNLTARPREINLVLLLGLAGLLSIPLAVNPSEAWDTFNEFLIKAILIFIVIVNVVRTERRLHWLLLLALVVSVYLSIYAIQDYQLGIFKIGRLGDNNLRIAGRIRGLFENSNDLALHLITMAPIAVCLAFAKRGVFRKIVYLGSAVLMVAAIVVSFSRGGFLALATVSFFLIRKLGRDRRLSTTAGFVLAIVLFFAVAPGGYTGRLSTIFDTGSDITGSASQRNQVLNRSILVTLRYPLFGVGLGNFHYKSFQELGTHNAYTQVGSEIGIAAMVVYIMFLLYPYKRLTEIQKATYQQKDERFYYYMSVGLQASLLAYMVASFFAAVAYQWYIYYLVGYAIALRRIYLLRTQSGLSGAAADQPFVPSAPS
jgi:hypothetical protein